MNKSLIVSKSTEINSTPQKLWDVLTNPEKIKVYLFGTETITDWKVGSPIIFQGEYQGHQYKDKGNVLHVQENEYIKYNYWSGFSGLEDKLENYSIVSYHIEILKNKSLKFTWTQQGFASEKGQQHLENGLPNILKQIKELSEES